MEFIYFIQCRIYKIPNIFITIRIILRVKVKYDKKKKRENFQDNLISVNRRRTLALRN